jgi:two-component sensor histidine kinase
VDKLSPLIQAANSSTAKSKLRAFPLRWHLSVLGLLIILPLLFMGALVAFRYVQAEQQRYHDEAFAIVRDAAQSIDQELNRYVVALQILAQSTDLAQGDFEHFYNAAKQLSSILPDTAIVLRRTDGQTIFDTNFPWGSSLPGLSEQTFIAAEKKSLTNRTMVISDLFVGISHNTYVTVVQPVILNGEVAYLLSLGISAKALSQILSSQVRSPNWLIGLVDNNDRIIGRNWEPEKYIGQKASAQFIQNTQQESGTFVVPTLEGVPVYDVYVRSRLTGWRIGAGIPVSLFEAPARRSLYGMTTIIAAGLICSLSLGYVYAGRLLRPVKALLNLSNPSGQVVQAPPASGIKEFDAVAGTLAAAFSELNNRGGRLQENEARIGADLQDMTLLHRLSDQLLANSTEIKKCLEEILETAIIISGADKGNIQLLDQNSGVLVIAAQRGFDEAFLKFFAKVSDGDTACGAAMSSGQRVVVEDVLTSEIFVGQPAQTVLTDAGVRAVISSPLMSSTGTLLGMISTYCSKPHRPDERQLRLMDLLSRQSADYLERKRSEEIRDTLSREVQHRSNNLLAVVQALANRSLTSYATTEEARTAFEGRLQALARSNRQLSKSDWSRMSLRELVQVELEPFKDRTLIEGSDLAISSQHAQSFSLALHELTTNAVKYGALSNGVGSVAIFWTVDHGGADGLLKFRWREKGGPAVAMPAREGFGTSLLKAVFPNLRVEYTVEGLICEIDIVLGKAEIETANALSAKEKVAG